MSTLFLDFMEKDSLRKIAGGDVAALGRSVEKLNDIIASAHQTQLEPTIVLPVPDRTEVDERLSSPRDNSKEAGA